MTVRAEDLASGKGEHDENFPVAAIVAARHRAAILAFYRFVRLADDVSDNQAAPPEEKLRLLEDLRRSLAGEADISPEGVDLRKELTARKLTADHVFDLLEAFRRDCTKRRYANWDDLMDYCRYSAMPVGRFVLDVHGESRDLWPANDALCAALQVINHLQDCAKDRRGLDRVYLPLDAMARHGAGVEMLDEERSPPALIAVIRETARRNGELLKKSAPFHRGIKSPRLALEVSVIQTLAESLNRKLRRRDPLFQRVHHAKGEIVLLSFLALVRFLVGRLRYMTAPQAKM
jgi:hydroxysqualene synthase